MRAKRAITILLAVFMVLGLFTPMAVATDNAEIELLQARHTFADVGETWYDDAVQFVFQNNVMQGINATTFNPSGQLSRAEVTAIVFRLEMGRRANNNDSRVNNFNDVGDTWYAPYVTWAFNNGIVFGTSDTTFNPNGRVTRQEFAVMVYRYAMSPMGGQHDAGNRSPQWWNFTDINDIASWALNAMRWMNYHGIITGLPNNTINPNGNATRAEAAAMMMRTMRTMNVGNHTIPPRPQPDPNEEIDRLVQDGLWWRNLLDRGFTRVQIQDAFDRELIRLVNNIRREHGLPEFVVNQDVMRVARLRAEESLYHDSRTHVSETTGLRDTEHFNTITGLNVWSASENIAFGGLTPQGVVNSWMQSSGHRNFILVGHYSAGQWSAFTQFTQLGVGFDFNANTGNSRYTFWLMAPTQ